MSIFWKDKVKRKLASIGWHIRAISTPQLTPFHQIPQLVSQAPQQVVILDVFDTLLARTVNPEHVKILSADRLARSLGLQGFDGPTLYKVRRKMEAEINQENLKIYGEAEFRFHELAARLYSFLKSSEPVLSHISEMQFYKRMLEIEVIVEKEVLRPIPGAADLIRTAQHHGKNIVLLSDFYLPASVLKNLLRTCEISTDRCPLFVSCDIMASKRSGRAYDVLLERIGERPENLLMVGDNIYSDYYSAKSRGITTIIIDVRERHHFYNSPDASVTNLTAMKKVVHKIIKSSSLGKEKNFRALVPSFLAFIEKLYAELRAKGIKHVAFLAREGQGLRLMFDAFQDAYVPIYDRIQTYYVRASRRSTYIASLRPLDEENFSDYLQIYDGISTPLDFLRSLGFDDDTSVTIIAEAGLKADCVSKAGGKEGFIAHLRASASFRKFYEHRRKHQKALLTRYFLQLGIPLDKSPLVLVDIGWKGSMQDFISRAVEPPQGTIGFYFGLISYGGGVENKSGLIFDNYSNNKYWAIYSENRSLFEILLCADHNSALSYDEDMNGKVIVLEDQEDPQELDWINNTILPIRNDLLNAFQELLESRKRHICERKEWDQLAANYVADLVFHPWLPQMKWLVKKSRHRENFGVFSYSKFADEKILIQQRVQYLKGLLKSPKEHLKRQFWPAGSLYVHLGKLPTLAYAMVRRRQGKVR